MNRRENEAASPMSRGVNLVLRRRSRTLWFIGERKSSGNEKKKRNTEVPGQKFIKPICW